MRVRQKSGHYPTDGHLSSNIISLGLGGILPVVLILAAVTLLASVKGGAPRVDTSSFLTFWTARRFRLQPNSVTVIRILPNLMEQTLGEKGLLTATYGADAMTVEEQILAEEQQRKNR